MGNEKHLIPLNQRTESERKAIQSKGGKATKGIPKWKLKTCKRCNLPCPLKDSRSEQGLRCMIPDLKRKFLESATDPVAMINSLIMDAFALGQTAKSHKEKYDSFSAKLSLKKEIHPNTQQIEVQQDIGLNVADLRKDFMEWQKEEEIKNKTKRKRKSSKSKKC